MNPLLQILMILAGAALMFDTLIVASRHRIHTGVIMPVLLGLPLVLWGFLHPVAAALLPAAAYRLIGQLMILGYAVFAVTFLITLWLIWRAPSQSVPPVTDALIILGAALIGHEVSRTLDRRLRRSAEIMRQHPWLKAIVSGGQCAGGTRPEAVAMAERLERLGIPPDRIMLEDQSQSTIQNLMHSLPMLERSLGRKPRLVAIVTSDYHVFRALRMARQLGYDAIGIAAPTPRDVLLNNLLREYIGLIRYLLFGD